MSVFLNTLYVTTPDAYLRLEGETVCVMIEKEKRLQVPLHHLGGFVLFGHTMMSPGLMGRCADDGRSVVWLGRNGDFRFRLQGPVNGNILLRQVQFQKAAEAAHALVLAKAFIAGKLRNSRQLLMRAARESTQEDEQAGLNKATKLLEGNIRKLESAENLDSVRGLEGDGARIYFGQLNTVMRPSVRNSFTFNTRNRRPPKDRFNALISFLYALVLSDCRSALETVGLDPQMGFLHVPRPGRESLALDLMEEFRPVMADRLALTLINRGQLKEKDFDCREGGSVLLNDTGRRTVITAYQERKQETLNHPVLEQSVAIGLLPQLQARLLARYLREDIDAYVPFLQR
ncbi:MAG: type I-C CRISPR-associated endonuclease Cas1 [Gammaproteobacteria bacterium]|nr:type I-C CRISPR-associated endonuclease Cas1 [Gammaproteobacteria bacterium]MBQ0839966.1 type I-C CRISPR-associated endonuclease Cas1 [Gammaproteobacteria bacterium]